MAFKMKNAALKKQVEVAACPRAAMKMAAKEAAMKRMKSPTKAMKTPMKAMDAPTKAMKESAAKFNAELKKASAEGKLKGKFKEAVDSAPMKKMDGGKKGEAGMTKQDRKVQRLQKEIIKARDEGNDRRITEIYKEMREMYKADKNKSPNKAMKESPAKLARPDRDKDRKPRPKPRPRPRPTPRPRPDKREFMPGVLKEHPKKKKPMIAGESATKKMESPAKVMTKEEGKRRAAEANVQDAYYIMRRGRKVEVKPSGKYYREYDGGDPIPKNLVTKGRKTKSGKLIPPSSQTRFKEKGEK